MLVDSSKHYNEIHLNSFSFRGRGTRRVLAVLSVLSIIIVATPRLILIHSADVTLLELVSSICIISK